MNALFQITSRPQGIKVLSRTSNAVNNVQRRPPIPAGSSSLVRDRTDKTGATRPNPDNGAYDVKLVEMINTVIVDRSPSVKWEDVGKIIAATHLSGPCCVICVKSF